MQLRIMTGPTPDRGAAAYVAAKARNDPTYLKTIMAGIGITQTRAYAVDRFVFFEGHAPRPKRVR
jgi:hypothetical protein